MWMQPGPSSLLACCLLILLVVVTCCPLLQGVKAAWVRSVAATSVRPSQRGRPFPQQRGIPADSRVSTVGRHSATTSLFDSLSSSSSKEKANLLVRGGGGSELETTRGVGRMRSRRPSTTALSALESDQDSTATSGNDDDDAVSSSSSSLVEPTTGDSSPTSSSSSTRGWIVAIGVASLAVTALTAHTVGTLPAPWLFPGELVVVPYTNAYLWRDVGSTLLTATLAYILAKTIGYGFEQHVIDSKDARKLIHTLSAPLFLLFWPLFSPATGSQVFCALVPLWNIVRLYLASTGQGEPTLALSVSRSGELKEALGGPMIYVCIIFVAILAFWRTSAAGIVALCAMAVGDGLADLVGRRYGASNPWKFVPNKSVAGSTAFFIGSTLAIVGLLQWMTLFPHVGLVLAHSSTGQLWLRAALVAFLTAALELVPIADDNYTVPLAGAALGWILFPIAV